MRALVVVDYQNDFVDGSLGGPDAAAIEPSILELVRGALDAGDDVLITMDTHGDDYLETHEGRLLPVPHCIEGTRGWELHGGLAAYMGDPRCRVLRKSTFGCPELMGILRGYDEIELCGVATNICVLANAVIARTASPEARVVVRRACVASYDRDLGERALEVMGSLQVEVL